MDNGLMNGEEEQQNTTLKATERVHGRRQMSERDREPYSNSEISQGATAAEGSGI